MRRVVRLTTTVDAGDHTSYQVTNLETGRPYFFAAQAYNSAGQVSAPSAEVSTTLGTAALSLTNFMTQCHYTIKARARSATNTSDTPENTAAERSFSFAITSADAAVINLVSDRAAPQPSGTSVAFTAVATGSTGSMLYEFQWSLFDGASWMVLQDWSTNARLTWTPTAPNPKYQILLRVRAGRNLSASASITMPFPIQ
jgi:hypothetical protein